MKLQGQNLPVKNARFEAKIYWTASVKLLHEGNVTGLMVKDYAVKTLLEIPATEGVVGVVVAPWLAALGVITVLVANCRIVV